MRPIKYRAWDKHKKRMLKVQNIAFSDDGEVVSVYTAGPDFSNDKQALMGEKPDLENVVLEQYTGLKDKSGIEIYESDIIRYENDKYGKIFLGGIGFRVVLNGKLIDYDWLLYATPDIEVVGNVHENSELLEAEK